MLGNHVWQQPGPSEASSYTEPRAVWVFWEAPAWHSELSRTGFMPPSELQASMSTEDSSFRGASASLRTCFLEPGCDFQSEEGGNTPSDPSEPALPVGTVFGGDVIPQSFRECEGFSCHCLFILSLSSALRRSLRSF